MDNTKELDFKTTASNILSNTKINITLSEWPAVACAFVLCMTGLGIYGIHEKYS